MLAASIETIQITTFSCEWQVLAVGPEFRVKILQNLLLCTAQNSLEPKYLVYKVKPAQQVLRLRINCLVWDTPEVSISATLLGSIRF